MGKGKTTNIYKMTESLIEMNGVIHSGRLGLHSILGLCFILLHRVVKRMLCTQLNFANASRQLILDSFFQTIYFNE